MQNTEMNEPYRSALGALVPGTAGDMLGVVESAALRDWFGSSAATLEVRADMAVLRDENGDVVREVPASSQHQYRQMTRFAGEGVWKLTKVVDSIPAWAEDAAGRKITGDGVVGFSRMATVILAQLGKAGWEWRIDESPYELRWVAGVLGMPDAVRVGVEPVAFVSWLCERRPLVAGRLVDAVLLT